MASLRLTSDSNQQRMPKEALLDRKAHVSGQHDVVQTLGEEPAQTAVADVLQQSSIERHRDYNEFPIHCVVDRRYVCAFTGYPTK